MDVMRSSDTSAVNASRASFVSWEMGVLGDTPDKAIVSLWVFKRIWCDFGCGLGA